uniref:Uncharacterized protein n=1 Tax=Nelumbo nucifera TaxID=4432 RepID=A0A822XZD6_NELNU|nr:TPA_asm: hypothetical protein HUJ06_025638 [Nelumbo nucifera]
MAESALLLAPDPSLLFLVPGQTAVVGDLVVNSYIERNLQIIQFQFIVKNYIICVANANSRDIQFEYVFLIRCCVSLS